MINGVGFNRMRSTALKRIVQLVPDNDAPKRNLRVKNFMTA